MRKVAYKKWIPKQHLNGDTIVGTGIFEPGFSGNGKFHQWGSSYEEFENGPGNYTVAIIENPDGTISEVLPSHIKFLD